VTGRVTLAVLAAALTVGVTGCGGEETSGSEETQAAAGSSAQTVSVSETEFALDPDTVTLDAAGTYTFRAVNDGSIDHALELEGNGVEEETETIGAGESAELTVELKEGTYELYCPVGSHKAQGMVGKVVVGAGGAGGATTTNGETDETETDEDSGGYGY
jgi:plastocyanin